MYAKYKGNYETLEKKYNEEKQELEKHRKKGTSNKFMPQITGTQRELLKIDRELLEKGHKTLRNRSKLLIYLITMLFTRWYNIFLLFSPETSRPKLSPDGPTLKKEAQRCKNR